MRMGITWIQSREALLAAGSITISNVSSAIKSELVYCGVKSEVWDLLHIYEWSQCYISCYTEL